MALCTEAEQLTIEFGSIARKIKRKSVREQDERVNAWLERVRQECLSHALHLVEIYDARGGVETARHIFVAGDFVMSQNDQRVQIHGAVYGGVITGSIDSQTIGQLQNNVQTKGKIDQNGEELFKQAYGQLESVENEQDRTFIARRLTELQEELAKEEPKESIVDSLIGGLQAYAEALPAITVIATWVNGLFGA